MAKQDLTDNGQRYTDANGTVWDQVTFRKLKNRDYMRVLLEHHGRRLLMQFGEPLATNPDLIAWQWELPLHAEDAVCVLGDLTFGMLGAARNTDGYIEQVTLAKADLETKVAGLATELRDLKDAPKKEG
jgi:hypothetical protein